jgi:hypothetical protein
MLTRDDVDLPADRLCDRLCAEQNEYFKSSETPAVSAVEDIAVI